MVNYNPDIDPRNAEVTGPFSPDDSDKGIPLDNPFPDNEDGRITVDDSDKFTSGNRPSALDDPRLRTLIQEQKRARESGDLIDLMKIAGMTGRSSGLTRQDLVDAGLLDSPAESRAKRKKSELEALQELRDQRADYEKKGKEARDKRTKESKEKRDAKKDRLIQRMTDEGVSEEDIEKYRAGGQTSTFAVRRLQEARAKKRGEAAQATKATPAKDEPIDIASENQMLMDDILNFGPVPPDPKQPTRGAGFDEMLDQVGRVRDRTRKVLGKSDPQAEIDRQFLLGMDYLDYLTGEGAGTFLGDVRNSPERKQFERDMQDFGKRIRAGEFGSRDPLGGPSEFTLEQRERAMDRARPKAPPTPAAPSFRDFASGKVDGSTDPSMLDADGDGIDDRIAALEKENKRMQQMERLKRLEQKNRQLRRDGGMRPQGTGTYGTGPMPQSTPQDGPQMPTQQPGRVGNLGTL